MGDKLNFRIVEGSTEIDADYEDVKRDYLNPDVRVKEILEKHNISIREYYRLKERIARETGVDFKPSSKKHSPTILTVTQHITQDTVSQKYRVAKYINGMLRHFGRYSTLEEAIRVRDVMFEHDWDYDYYVENIKPHYFTAMQHEKKSDAFSKFKEDYLQGMTVKDLRKKYGLSIYHYYRLAESINHEMGLTHKPMKVRG